MLYNIVLVSTVKHSESAIHIHIAFFWGFPSHLGHHSAPSRVPGAIQYVLVIYFIHGSVYFNPSLVLGVQFSSVTQSCPTLCWNCSTPCFSVLHQCPEPIQTHVHRVGDIIQPSHPLLSPSPPAFNFCQHQGLFK